MSDKKGEKVEGFRLTDEQKSFQKKVRTLNEVKQLLSLETLRQKAKFQNLQELWRNLEEEYSRVVPPTEAARELEGMDFDIRY